MKKKKTSEFKLVVAGISIAIDYDKQLVFHEATVSAEIIKSTNQYLLNEGFLDSSFIATKKKN